VAGRYLGGHVSEADSGLKESDLGSWLDPSPVVESPVVPPRLPFMRWGVPGPALQGLIALAIYVGVFIVAFGQALASQLDQTVVGQNYVDPNLFVWLWHWWPYAISHWTNPLYSNQIGAPAGYNLAAWTTTTPAVALLMWPVTAIWGSVVSFNLTLLLAPPTAAWAAFVAARRLTKRFWASLLAGTVYGFNIYEQAHNVSGQPNVSVTLLFPLIVYLVLLWWDGTLGRTGFMIWMAVALALEFYTFTEGFFDLTLVTALALVAGFAVAGRGGWRKVARLTGLMAVSYVGALVLTSPYLIYELRNMPAGLNRNQPGFQLDLLGLVIPRSDRLWGFPALSAISHAHYDYAYYIGIPLLVLLLLFAIFTWSSKLARLLAVMFVVIVALAAGSNLTFEGNKLFALPWGGLWNLPIARSVETDRFILFGYLILALVLALWLARPVRSRVLTAARWGLGVLALAAMFANLPTFAETVTARMSWKPAIPSATPTDAIPPFIADGLYKKYVRPGQTIVVVSRRGNAGMLFQSDTDFYFRIAGGFINASLNSAAAIPMPIEVLSHPTPARVTQFKAYLKAAGISDIIVEQAWSEHWMDGFGHILGVRPISVGGVTIYRTTPAKVKAVKASHKSSPKSHHTAHHS
jgi:hypothetical protein